MSEEMVRYYARRAAEYDRVYAMPPWQDDLATLQQMVSAAFSGRRVFEVACGTGYWTQQTARHAARVHATDLNDETLAIARARTYGHGIVTFDRADAYSPAREPHRFDAGPVESPNPFHGIYAAVARRPRSGEDPGWQPGQRMTREEAVRSFTTWNAFASHQEEDLGALTPGKRADLIVCSDDVFTCPEERIKEIAPLLTMVGGEVVYTREDSPSAQSSRAAADTGSAARDGVQPVGARLAAGTAR